MNLVKSLCRISIYLLLFVICIPNPRINKYKESEAIQLCPTLCDSVDWGLPGSLSMGFSRQGYWSELQFPSSGDLPNPGREPMSPELQADSLPSDPPGKLTKNKHKIPKN